MKPGPAPPRDRVLEQWVDELLHCDPRLAAVRVSVRVDGGVAHLAGTAPDQPTLDLLRDLVGRLAGVFAVWDHVRIPAQPQLRVVDFGVGATKQYADSIGIDRVRHAGVDVVADLSGGVPLRDDSIDRAYAVHVLEHVVAVLALFDELHRVVAPRGVLHVMTPDWRHVNAVADPTHVRFFDVQTFKYVCEARPGHRRWRPLHAATDGASVFADLTPVKDDVEPAPELLLARFFD